MKTTEHTQLKEIYEEEDNLRAQSEGVAGYLHLSPRPYEAVLIHHNGQSYWASECWVDDEGILHIETNQG